MRTGNDEINTTVIIYAKTTHLGAYEEGHDGAGYLGVHQEQREYAQLPEISPSG